MTSVRFFASAMLRPEEEVDGELVRWMPSWSTVEFSGPNPVVGVWQSGSGQRRVCWYVDASREAIGDLNAERYEQEPFWIVHLEPAGPSGQLVVVEECDRVGRLVCRRVWGFDRAGMPASETEYTDDRSLAPSREYSCTDDGRVYAVRERIGGASEFTDLPPPHRNPVPEFCAEPFPCGGTIADGTVRLLAAITQNSLQGRFRSAYRASGTWRPAITTLTVISHRALGRYQSTLEFQGERVAPVVGRGILEHPRFHGPRLTGLAEAVPDRPTLEEVVERGALAPLVALSLARQIGDVALAAHQRGIELGGIRPELIYLTEGLDAGVELDCILHRGPSWLAATCRGEAVLWPPVFHADFSAASDVDGLAQLVWYMLTGSHPFLAREDMRWNELWSEYRHDRRRRQPWRGPPALGAVLERVLFGGEGARPTVDRFLAELQRAHTT